MAGGPSERPLAVSPVDSKTNPLSKALTKPDNTLLDSLSTFFPEPVATQASVDELGEFMFTYQDGVGLNQRVANTDNNIQAELAALTESLPILTLQL